MTVKDYVGYSMCFEGGQAVIYYSGTSVWSNPIARMFANTQYHLFLRMLSDN